LKHSRIQIIFSISVHIKYFLFFLISGPKWRSATPTSWLWVIYILVYLLYFMCCIYIELMSYQNLHFLNLCLCHCDICTICINLNINRICIIIKFIDWLNYLLMMYMYQIVCDIYWCNQTFTNFTYYCKFIHTCLKLYIIT